MRETLSARGDHSGYDRRYRDLPPEQVAELEASGRPYTIRFKMPLEGQTVMPDLLRGDIVFENSQVTDYVLLKSSGLPTYHLAHVVDDHFMRITHVTRGIEWLSTAPVHVQLWQAFGWEMPVFVHLPVILSPDGQGKLSKRRRVFLESGEPVLVMAHEFQEAGYLPAAVRNFLATIGWSFGEDTEKFSTEQAIARFDLADLSPSPTQLPYSKLDWLNGQYIQELSPAALAEAITPFLEAEGYVADQDRLLPVMPAMSVRLKRLSEAPDFLRFLFESEPAPLTLEDVTHKQLEAPAALAAFIEARAFLAALPAFEAEAIGAGLSAIGERHTASGKAGPFLGKARLVATRQRVSPPLFESIEALGRERALARFDEAIAVLQEGATGA
jgi:glutamyl-tRNA synthetase